MAITLDSSDMFLYYFRGKVNLANNKIGEVIADYKKALSLYPDFEDAKKALKKLNADG